MEVTALKLFRVGRSSIGLYEDGALMTRKSAMVASVLGALPTRTDNITTPIGCTTSPMKSLNCTGVKHNWLGLIPIVKNASQKRMSTKLPLLTRILQVVKFTICIVTTSASSCGWRIPSSSFSLKFIVISLVDCWVLGETLLVIKISS